jgi:lipopolysaccharide transport system ATP-binding protein
MNDIAIRVDNLGKKYRITERHQRSYKTLRESLAHAVLAPFRKQAQSNGSGQFWALRNLSLDIKQGQVLGIIGRNGAGKSTLLKILSRVTAPTTGFADIQGRVGSLLEVGTGFHPELSGRDNIYLNGAILGMKKSEIDRQFDEIVAFAEVEKFIDTPVKHYSSGMYLRLAFAVAAHIQPEILLVDEVLAVGDAAFQNKCLGKMRDVTKAGRTVLFVSHNMGAIAQLCKQVLWIADGGLERVGSSSEVIQTYLTRRSENHTVQDQVGSSQSLASKLPTQVIRAQIVSENEQPSTLVRFDRRFKVHIEYQVTELIRSLSIICRLVDSQGNVVWTSWDTDTTDWNERAREPGRYLSVCKVPHGLLRPGNYCLSVGFTDNRNSFDMYDNMVDFEISCVGYPLNEDRIGIITPILDWQVERID